MIVIRRLVDRQRGYTAIFLPGEPAKIFPTSEQEHARILQIYKQDRRYEGILNDFSDYDLGAASRPAAHAKPTRHVRHGENPKRTRGAADRRQPGAM